MIMKTLPVVDANASLSFHFFFNIIGELRTKTINLEFEFIFSVL